jgi:hypothetical protein
MLVSIDHVLYVSLKVMLFVGNISFTINSLANLLKVSAWEVKIKRCNPVLLIQNVLTFL